VVVVLAGCASGPPPAGAALDLEWLVGTWRATDDTSVTVETWARDGAGGYVATNATTVDGAVVHEERIRISDEGEGWFYRAEPSGQTPHAFALEEVGRRRVAFADPEHDWPQSIVYRRRGPRLRADLAGGDGSQRRAARWDFVLESR
jgi:hypothetical protein